MPAFVINAFLSGSVERREGCERLSYLLVVSALYYGTRLLLLCCITLLRANHYFSVHRIDCQRSRKGVFAIVERRQ